MVVKGHNKNRKKLSITARLKVSWPAEQKHGVYMRVTGGELTELRGMD